jgi:hypothetical protein
MANVVVSAIATWNGKALNKGKKEISAFDKQVNKLGRTFATVFSAAALLNYSKKAVQAFAADEKAAKALELQLRNVGFAFSAPAVETYISNLQKTTGVLDDQLRPAFQQLLTVTGSITKSQDALNTALDVSAATGKSLTEVSAALTRAYSGNTAGLSRLGAGISKATLKAGDMDEILAELNKKFAGQAQARLTTYSGKMDLLKVASENVKEEIGKGIIGALDALSDDNSINNATTQMEDFGKSIGKSITGVGILIGELKKIPGSRKATDILFGTNIFSMSAKLTELFAKDKFPSGPDRGGSERTASRVFVDQIRRENKIIRDTNKARADELAKLKAKSEVDKLSEKFDVERIGLMKALGEATDEETKLRIQSKLAILDNNEALAKKLNADLLAQQAADLLAEAARKAASALDNMPNKFDAMFTNLTALFVKGGSDLASAMSLAASSVRFSAEAADFAAGTGRYAYPLNPIYGPSTTPTNQGTTNIDVTVNTGAVLSSEQDLQKYVQDAVATTLKGGGGLTPAGSLIVFQ